MILRRVIEHFKKQEWTAIALDFLIVVVGVFVGMQVTNWNEARADRATVVRHLSEIAEDLQAQIDFDATIRVSALARIAAVDYVYDKAFGVKLPNSVVLSTESWPIPPQAPIPEERLDNLLGSINLIRVNVGMRSGYESLISAGHLGMIENKDIARKIQIYYADFDDLLDANNTFRGFRNNGVAQMYAHGLSSFDERPAEEIVALARENPDFAAYLRTTREWAAIHLGIASRVRRNTETLLGEINAELERLS